MFDRLQLAWYALRFGAKSVRVTPTWEMGRAKQLPVDYTTLAADGYRRNELVYACIRYLARAAGEPKYRVLLGEDKEAPPAHPLVKLLERPNDVMSLGDMMQATIVMLNIAGTCYWEKERARGGQVLKLWPMRPDRVSVVPGEFGPAGYIYTLGEYRVVYEPQDIIEFKYYDPLSDFFGLAPLAVCARAADADNERTDFTRAFFTNAAVPYGLLTTKGKLVEAEAKRIQQRWQEQYSGTTNWHKVAVLDSDATYQRVALTQQEMAFPDLTALSETRVCMTFGVPPILIGSKVGLDSSTYSNYESAKRAFWEETMSPILRHLEDTLNFGLADDFGAEIDIDLSEIRALQEDRTSTFQRAQTGIGGGWVTVNEARAEVGLDLVDGGDIFLRSMSYLPVDVAETVEELTAPKEIPAQLQAANEGAAQGEEDEETPPDEEAPPAEGTSKALQPQAAKSFGARVDQVARANELAFAQAARRLWKEERAAVLALLPAGKARKEAWHDIFLMAIIDLFGDLRDKWIEIFGPLFGRVMVEQAEVIEAEFGVAFDLTNPAIQRFLEEYTFKFAQKMGQTSVEEIRELIMRSQAEGWSVTELQRQLQDKFTDWSEIRAECVARSETIRAANAGTKEAYRQAGIEQIQWLSYPDDRRCDWCAEMEGRVTGINDAFFQEGDTFTVTDAEGNPHDMYLDYEAVEYPPLHPMCILPGNEVVAPGRLLAATESLYVGRCIEVSLANGRRLTVTENHPILTRHGWMAAKFIRQGDDVFCATDANRISASVYPDNDYTPAAIEQVFRTFVESDKVVTRRMPAAAEDFHGDGRFIDGKIKIVYRDGFLMGDGQLATSQQGSKFVLSGDDAATLMLNGNGLGSKLLGGNDAATRGDMSLTEHLVSHFRSSFSPANEHAIRDIARRNASFYQSPPKDSPTDATFPREFLLRFAGQVALQEVVKVRDFDVQSHVYNLQVDPYELYICNGAIVKNCRCTIVAVFT